MGFLFCKLSTTVALIVHLTCTRAERVLLAVTASRRLDRVYSEVRASSTDGIPTHHKDLVNTVLDRVRWPTLLLNVNPQRQRLT